MQFKNPTHLQPITAADKVFVQLQQAIVEGEIAAGAKISEPELAKRYEVSRATLREAINRLEKCHLVERQANVGARVVECTVEGLLDLYITQDQLMG